MVIGGHQRLEAAKALGLSKVPVVFVDIDEHQAKVLNIALNKIHGDWDLAVWMRRQALTLVRRRRCRSRSLSADQG
jgi:ParB-like chromosome segregation protein Spo0J